LRISPRPGRHAWAGIFVGVGGPWGGEENNVEAASRRFSSRAKRLEAASTYPRAESRVASKVGGTSQSRCCARGHVSQTALGQRRRGTLEPASRRLVITKSGATPVARPPGRPFGLSTTGYVAPLRSLRSVLLYSRSPLYTGGAAPARCARTNPRGVSRRSLPIFRCASLASHFPVYPVHGGHDGALHVRPQRRSATSQSGDKSPHSTRRRSARISGQPRLIRADELGSMCLRRLAIQSPCGFASDRGVLRSFARGACLQKFCKMILRGL